MARYVPKTYNNRRILRLIVGAVITVALSIVILFLILFFIFRGYEVEGRLEIPWLIEDTSTLPRTDAQEDYQQTPQPSEETETDVPPSE